MRRQVWMAWMAVAVAVLALSLIGFRGAAPSTDNISIGQDDGQLQTDETIRSKTKPGVKGLTNRIIVEPAFTRDHKLAMAVWNVLQGVPTLNGNDTLRVNVKNSVVKLEGVVEHSIQKEAAEKAVASVPGVATVINLIEVNSKARGESITEKDTEKMLQEGVQLQP
jgi:BON domain-containing protein